MSKPVIVLVPGAWHRPQHYHRLTQGLKDEGYETVGVTLPSVDSSPPHESWDKDAEAVRHIISEYLSNGKDVVAVGHSYGGVPMSEAVKGLGKAAREKQRLKGGLVRLVYMCAMALPEGQSHANQIKPQTPEEEEIERQHQECLKHGGMRITDDGAIILGKEAVRDFFYNGCDPGDVEEAFGLLGSFPSGPLSVPATYTAYHEIPSTYIVCEKDLVLSMSVQERIIAQGKGAFHVERCQEGHSPFLSNPSFITGCVRRAAGESV